MSEITLLAEVTAFLRQPHGQFIAGQREAGRGAPFAVINPATGRAIAAFILEAWLAPRGHSPEFIRTVLLQMLVTAQWVYMINCRSSDSFSLSMGLLRNKGIWLVTGVLLLMQLVIIYVPLMQSMFGTEALPLRYWFVTLVIGVAMFLVVEIEKRLTRRFRKTA